MSVTSGFFNSKNHDRTYDATDFGKIFDGIINDGVYGTQGRLFKVEPYSGLSVSVAPGRAWFNHTWILNDGQEIRTFRANLTNRDRIDAIVIKVDRNESARTDTIEIMEGEEGLVNPVPPTMIHANNIDTYPIAYVTIKHNDPNIAAAQIQDTVGTSSCPIVTGPLEVASFEDWLTQWTDEFYTWFNHLHNELDSNQAAHLQNQIDTLNAGKQNEDTMVELTLSASGWHNGVYSLESTYPSTTYDITSVLPTENTTNQQLMAWINANCGGYNTTNVIRARGDVPNIDIVIGLCIRQKLSSI